MFKNLNTDGLEFNFSYSFNNQSNFNIAYTYLFDESYVNDYNFSKYSINSLRHQLNTKIILNYSDRLFQTFMFKYGERSNKFSHKVLDISLNYKLSNKNYFFINVNNLFNENYYETNLVPMPGRNFLFGIILYFD